MLAQFSFIGAYHIMSFLCWYGIKNSHTTYMNLDFDFLVQPSPLFLFCDIGCFDPLCVRSPLDTLESGVLFHIWWLSKQLIVLHDSPPWKVALCLPYPTCTFTPTLESMGWNDQLWNTLATVVGRPTYESYCWLNPPSVRQYWLQIVQDKILSLGVCLACTPAPIKITE